MSIINEIVTIMDVSSTQVVQLHAELEQERSKNSTLKSEMAKVGVKNIYWSMKTLFCDVLRV